MLTIGFCFTSKEINNFFVLPLMQEGHKTIGFTEGQKLLDYLENNTCHLLVMDYDDFCQKKNDILDKIKLLSETARIVLVTLLNSLAIKNILVQYKIYGVIAKPRSYAHILEDVKNYIELLEKNPAKTLRKHPRFAVQKNSRNLVKISFDNLENFYIGNITDISIGGLGAELQKEGSKYLIFKGKKANCSMQLDELKIEFKGQIVNFDGKKRIGMSFEEINPHDMQKLKNYILNLITAEKK